jgi:DNA recombination-mediator protein A
MPPWRLGPTRFCGPIAAPASRAWRNASLVLTGARPSDFVPCKEARAAAGRVLEKVRRRTNRRFDVRVHGELKYPDKRRDATHPVELLYFQGDWELVSTAAVAVVGTRKPTEQGVDRARRLTGKLVEDGFTIVSGVGRGYRYEGPRDGDRCERPDDWRDRDAQRPMLRFRARSLETIC